MRIRLFCIVAFVLVASFTALPSASACPACQDNINASVTTLDINGGASGGNGLTSLESGYSWSVIFLMTVPFCIVGFLGFAIYRECRKIDTETVPPPSDR